MGGARVLEEGIRGTRTWPMEEGRGRLGNEAAGPSVLVLFPSRATLGIPIIPNFLVWVSECVSG